MNYRFEFRCDQVDWGLLRDTLISDCFDNGRTSDEYRQAAENSHTSLVVFDNDRLIGNARAMSDGVCNAYIVDVWVHSDYRRKGLGTEMMVRILDRLKGQHVYLFTDDHVEFYESLGFTEQPVGLSLVVGPWLNRTP